ncbi:MAG TPA: hypothetical protein VNY09_00360, partial [Candidatus Sulfotelmatobacter sp.]|nr:hypothetical protein [Candidatus Sulfotelmatobacter sp.]
PRGLGASLSLLDEFVQSSKQQQHSFRILFVAQFVEEFRPLGLDRVQPMADEFLAFLQVSFR